MSQQITDGQTYSFGYSYNLAGMLAEETYPSGRKVKNTFQTDRNFSKIETMLPGGSYTTRADNFSYTVTGAVSSMMLGNSKWENAQFNSRLQPTQLGLGTSSSDQSLWKVNYDYGQTDNNGNIKQQTITVPSINVLVQTYAYDSLNRIKTATETQNSNPTWKQTFAYDRYGNRNFDTSNTTTLGSCPQAQCNPTVDTANNHFTSGQGYSYDNAGNVTADAQGRTFVYDGENKQREIKDSNSNSIGQYFYDGDGKRVKKISAADTSVFIYDASGKLAAEYLLTNVTPITPVTSYLTTDTLGSPRVITDANGNITSRRDFMPFGEEISGLGNRISAIGYQTDSVRQKFTGYQRDTESDLDYAQARTYSAKLGRFTSLDTPFSDQDTNNGQSWNLYVYARNNPENYFDPNGRRSTHTDRDGNVVAVYDDGDLGVYKHDNLNHWDRKSKLNNSGDGVTKMGETERWDEFRDHNIYDEILPNVAPGARILFGDSWQTKINTMVNQAQDMDLRQRANNLKPNRTFDIKNSAGVGSHYEGRLLNGRYVTAESAGNYLAGYLGATGTYFGFYISEVTFMKMAGALEKKQFSVVTAILIGITAVSPSGVSYGPPPYYGERVYAGEMIHKGFEAGVKEVASHTNFDPPRY